MKKVILVLCCLLVAGIAHAETPKDVTVVNTPDVNVANVADVNVVNMPDLNVANIPDVSVVNTPDVNVVSMPTPVETVVCYLAPEFGYGGTETNTLHTFFFGVNQFICPEGVAGINVQRAAISLHGSPVAKFGVTLAFGENEYLEPSGFLAALTDGMPSASVAQSFILSPSGSVLKFAVRVHAYSGDAEETLYYHSAKIYLIGTPLP